MRRLWITCSLLIPTLFACTRNAASQTDTDINQGTATYGLRVAVDEVNLTFHAADAHGLPINNLKLDELNLFDNGKPPRKILSFQLLQNFPIRAGILIDTSESMRQYLSSNRAISIKYAQQLLRQQSDQAFVMDFGRLSNIIQPWTGDPDALTVGIRRVTAGGESRLQGTALFDTVFHTCFSQFGKIDNAASGNFVLLFSDGEDNASYLSMKETVDMCQRNNTAIYAFRAKSSPGSPGPETLAELASKTGGRVFNGDDSDNEILDDLRIIEADLRNRYRLIYKPAEIKHDGSFHRIEMKTPERVDSIFVRSGYYAPENRP